MFLQAFKSLKFSSLPKPLWFQEKVENEIIRTSWNSLLKLPIPFSWKTPKSLSVFELRHQKWLGYGPQNKKTSKYIWQPETGLVISSCPFFLPTINSIKMKLNFQRIFDNPFSKFHSKEFLEWIGYVSSFLPKLEYIQWVTNSTPDLKTPSSKPSDVLGWAFGTNRTRRLFLIK